MTTCTIKYEPCVALRRLSRQLLSSQIRGFMRAVNMLWEDKVPMAKLPQIRMIQQQMSQLKQRCLGFNSRDRSRIFFFFFFNSAEV